MYQSVTGPREYLRVLACEKWADLDAGPVSKAIAANADLAVEELAPELSTPNAGELPTLIQLARVRLHAEKTRAWESIVNKELVPEYKNAGYKPVKVWRVRFGGPTTDYSFSCCLVSV